MLTEATLQQKDAYKVRQTPVLVAAIDFGTTNSGWAYSLRQTYLKDPTKISTRIWRCGQNASAKAPTSILIKPDGKTLAAFGFDAEIQFSDDKDVLQREGYYFFTRFKMILGQENVNRDLQLEDISGKKLLAITVFSLSIRFLKDDLVETVVNSGLKLAPTEILWVLTVPAIWKDSAKQFMREAAEQAGIAKTNLLIALESEVASVFCSHLPLERFEAAITFSPFKLGTRYLVLDAGGGTVDITVHEIGENSKLKELHKSNGGHMGSTKVDENFIKILEELVGQDVIEGLKVAHSDEYIELLRDFDIQKREVSPDKQHKLTVRLPFNILELVQNLRGKSVGQVIKESKFSHKVKFSADKVRLEPELAKELFTKPVDHVKGHLQRLLQEPTTNGTEVIIMVGGFSDSPMLHQPIKERYPGINVIKPEEAVLAVLKGAVMFGHNSTIISPRICKLTYGLQMRLPFDKRKHPQSSKVTSADGSEWCKNIFSKHVEIDQPVRLGETSPEVHYYPAHKDSTTMTINVYESTEKNPKFVTDIGCKLAGSLQIPLTGLGDHRPVSVQMRFGGTEIEVECTEKSTKQTFKLNIDFLRTPSIDS